MGNDDVAHHQIRDTGQIRAAEKHQSHRLISRDLLSPLLSLPAYQSTTSVVYTSPLTENDPSLSSPHSVSMFLFQVRSPLPSLTIRLLISNSKTLGFVPFFAFPHPSPDSPFPCGQKCKTIRNYVEAGVVQIKMPERKGP